MACYHESMTDYKTTLPDQELFANNRDDFWVFAYGSLMWHPDFDYTDRQPATLQGYSRSLCIYSWVHRGTQEKPGLVFGLDEGGSCDGIAYKIPPRAQSKAVKMLRERELVTEVYQEAIEQITLTGNNKRTITALCYTAVRNHEQYAGHLDHSQTYHYVRQGIGKSGINTEYVLNTYNHLLELGIQDETLTRLCQCINDNH